MPTKSKKSLALKFYSWPCPKADSGRIEVLATSVEQAFELVMNADPGLRPWLEQAPSVVDTASVISR